VDRLKEMGAWLAKYGESIYATRGGPFKPGAWGASTRKDDTIFVQVFEWPAAGELTLPPISRKVVSSRALTGGPAEVRQTPQGLTLRVPPANREAIATIIALKLDGPAADIAPVSVGRRSLAEGRKASASNVFQGLAAHGPEMACDGDANTRWATDAGTRQAWLELDLGAPVKFSKARIEEWDGDPGRVRAFRIEVFDGAAWKPVHEGKAINGAADLDLGPQMASKVRLNILDARDGPTISEFEVLR
jgi:alpha-L-fucosidase